VIDTDNGQSCSLLENPLSWNQSNVASKNIIGNSLTLNDGDAPTSSPATLITIPNLGVVQFVCGISGQEDLVYDNTTNSTLTFNGNVTLEAGESSDQVIVTSGAGTNLHMAAVKVISTGTATQCTGLAQAEISS
jgi:hypothetical protein